MEIFSTVIQVIGVCVCVAVVIKLLCVSFLSFHLIFCRGESPQRSLFVELNVSIYALPSGNNAISCRKIVQ